MEITCSSDLTTHCRLWSLPADRGPLYLPTSAESSILEAAKVEKKVHEKATCTTVYEANNMIVGTILISDMADGVPERTEDMEDPCEATKARTECRHSTSCPTMNPVNAAKTFEF